MRLRDLGPRQILFKHVHQHVVHDKLRHERVPNRLSVVALIEIACHIRVYKVLEGSDGNRLLPYLKSGLFSVTVGVCLKHGAARDKGADKRQR